MVEKRCKNCKYYVSEKEMLKKFSKEFWGAEDNIPDEMYRPFGSCHKAPPVAAKNYSLDRFPVVKETDWCGEWEPKE